MDENKISIVKTLLYDADSEDVKRTILQTKDKEILYAYAYNYNWDNGFDIPKTILDNEKCDLSIALLIFYRADGLSYLVEKSDNSNLPQWYSFIKRLYESILTGKYQREEIGEIEFKVPLSKVQFFKLKKAITEEENIFNPIHFSVNILNSRLSLILISGRLINIICGMLKNKTRCMFYTNFGIV